MKVDDYLFNYPCKEIEASLIFSTFTPASSSLNSTSLLLPAQFTLSSDTIGRIDIGKVIYLPIIEQALGKYVVVEAQSEWWVRVNFSFPLPPIFILVLLDINYDFRFNIQNY